MRKEEFKELVTRVAEQMPEAKNVQVFGYEIFVTFNGYTRVVEFQSRDGAFEPFGTIRKEYVTELDQETIALFKIFIDRVGLKIYEQYKQDPYFPG